MFNIYLRAIAQIYKKPFVSLRFEDGWNDFRALVRIIW